LPLGSSLKWHVPPPELSIPQKRPDTNRIEARVAFVESLPPDHTRPVAGGGAVRHWMETLDPSGPVLLETDTGAPVLCGSPALAYLAGWPDAALWDRILRLMCHAAGVDVKPMPHGLRQRQAGDLTFVVNYGPAPVTWQGEEIPAAGVAAWRSGTRVL
jgi:beta-galactosidase